MSGFREIKLQIPTYRAIAEKRLHFLICEAQPPILLGDILKLREWSADMGEYTGPTCYVQVTYMIGDPHVGLRVGFVAVQVKIKILTDRVRMPSSGS